MQAYPIDTHECAKHDFVLKSQSVFDAKRNLGPDNETKKWWSENTILDDYSEKVEKTFNGCSF